MRRPLLALLLAVAGCATLDTTRMSDSCRRLYDACLDGCPRADPPPQSSLVSAPWRTDVAACTDDCNRQGRACR